MTSSDTKKLEKLIAYCYRGSHIFDNSDLCEHTVLQQELSKSSQVKHSGWNQV